MPFRILPRPCLLLPRQSRPGRGPRAVRDYRAPVGEVKTLTTRPETQPVSPACEPASWKSTHPAALPGEEKREAKEDACDGERPARRPTKIPRQNTARTIAATSICFRLISRPFRDAIWRHRTGREIPKAAGARSDAFAWTGLPGSKGFPARTQAVYQRLLTNEAPASSRFSASGPASS